jgi:hypothetical protein
MADVYKKDDVQVEQVETHLSSSGDDLKKVSTMGTVKLTEGTIVYVPAPTTDPQGMGVAQFAVAMY